MTIEESMRLKIRGESFDLWNRTQSQTCAVLFRYRTPFRPLSIAIGLRAPNATDSEVLRVGFKFRGGRTPPLNVQFAEFQWATEVDRNPRLFLVISDKKESEWL